MRGRATRLLALDTYFLLDNDDDEGDGEDHSGVSDDGVEGEGRVERGKGGEEGKTKEMLEREWGKKGGEGREGTKEVFCLVYCRRVQYSLATVLCSLAFLAPLVIM